MDRYCLCHLFPFPSFCLDSNITHRMARSNITEFKHTAKWIPNTATYTWSTHKQLFIEKQTKIISWQKTRCLLLIWRCLNICTATSSRISITTFSCLSRWLIVRRCWPTWEQHGRLNGWQWSCSWCLLRSGCQWTGPAGYCNYTAICS